MSAVTATTPAASPPPVQGARLAGKVAIVTGGGGGFGAAICKRFAQEGCKVVVADLDPVAGQNVAAASSSSSSSSAQQPGLLHFHPMNVAREADWESVVRATLDRFGRVDICVNNAGTSYRNKPSSEVTEDEFDRVFSVNVKSIFHSSKHFIPALIKQGTGGSIINIASIGATRPRPGLVWYNASKAAVANATRGLASEYGASDVRVNAVCPLLSGTGLFETFVGVPFTPDNVRSFVGAVPLGRLTEPVDVANYCLFLASDEARFITGTCLDVDGGKSI